MLGREETVEPYSACPLTGLVLRVTHCPPRVKTDLLYLLPLLCPPVFPGLWDRVGRTAGLC